MPQIQEGTQTGRGAMGKWSHQQVTFTVEGKCNHSTAPPGSASGCVHSSLAAERKLLDF